MEFKDRIKNFTRNTVTKTMFLTKTEQAILQNQLKKVASISIYGGYNDFERGRAYINMEPSMITCFKIKHNPKFLKLTHQNILGSLLSLNIKMEVIGDILPEESAFFIIEEQKEFIYTHLKSIGRVPIELEEIDGRKLKRTIQLEERKAFIDSLRLDLVVSKIAGISRNEADILIKNELVKVNHLMTTKNTKKINESDIISIRKKGRFKVLNTQNTSKKGKIILVYGKFV